MKYKLYHKNYLLQYIKHGDENKQKYKRSYVFVLDFEIGYVYRYDVMTRDSEKIEEYLCELGHNPANIEWMLTRNKRIIK